MDKCSLFLAVALLPVLGQGQDVLLEKTTNYQASVGQVSINQITSTTRESLLVKTNGETWYIMKSGTDEAISNDSSGQKIFSEKRQIIGQFTSKIKAPAEAHVLAYFNNERPVVYDSTKKACYGILGITKTLKTTYQSLSYCEKDGEMKASFSQAEGSKIIFWPIIILIFFALAVWIISFLFEIKKITKHAYGVSLAAWVTSLGVVFTFLVSTNNLHNPSSLQLLTQVIIWPIVGGIIGIIIAAVVADMYDSASYGETIWDRKVQASLKPAILSISLLMCSFFSMILAGKEINDILFLLNQLGLWGVMVLSTILSGLVLKSIEQKKKLKPKT